MRRLIFTTESGTVAHELTEGSITVGRSPENMIVLDDPSVSSRHAQLRAAGDDYELVDLDSTNGTRVNGAEIKSVRLRAGDRIRLGKVEACFECETANEAQPLPVLEEPAAEPAEVSARPADFRNASPFRNRRTEQDPARLAIYAAAALAILAFLGSMLALAQMHPPTP
jgi:pSer/pThr/pTyr-binding forkhead associated (FHA) protein